MSNDWRLALQSMRSAMEAQMSTLSTRLVGQEEYVKLLEARIRHLESTHDRNSCGTCLEQIQHQQRLADQLFRGVNGPNSPPTSSSSSSSSSGHTTAPPRGLAPVQLSSRAVPLHASLSPTSGQVGQPTALQLHGLSQMELDAPAAATAAAGDTNKAKGKQAASGRGVFNILGLGSLPGNEDTKDIDALMARGFAASHDQKVAAIPEHNDDGASISDYDSVAGDAETSDKRPSTPVGREKERSSRTISPSGAPITQAPAGTTQITPPKSSAKAKAQMLDADDEEEALEIALRRSAAAAAPVLPPPPEKKSVSPPVRLGKLDASNPPVAAMDIQYSPQLAQEPPLYRYVSDSSERGRIPTPQEIPRSDSDLEPPRKKAKTADVDSVGRKETALGQKAAHNQDYVTAISHYSNAIDWFGPEAPATLYAKRSYAYGKLNRNNEAKKDAQKMIELRPTWYKGYTTHAALAARELDLETAMNDLLTAIAKCPDPKEQEKIKLHISKLDEIKISQAKRVARRQGRPADHSPSRGGGPTTPSDSNKSISRHTSPASVRSTRGAVRPLFEAGSAIPEEQTDAQRDSFGRDATAGQGPLLAQDTEDVHTAATERESPRSPKTRNEHKSLLSVDQADTHDAKDPSQSEKKKAGVPWLTEEGIRDLVSFDVWARGEEFWEHSLIRKASMAEHSLVGNVFSTLKKGGPSVHVEVHFSKEDHTRVESFQCECSTEHEPSEGDAESHDPRRPCEHVAALLCFWMDRQGKALQTGVTGTPQKSPRKTLYVTPARRISESRKKELQEIRDRVSGLNTTDLRKMLERNDQRRTGKKKELVERCVEAMLFGAIPRCPKCTKGYLRYHGGQYTCPGYYSESRRVRVQCDYEAQYDAVRRIPWRD